MLLEAHDIKVYIKDRLLLDIQRLTIHDSERIGLVGRNGCGKTTLLEVLTGRKEPEQGTIHTTGSCGLLPQLKQDDSTKSGGEVTQQYIVDMLESKPAVLLADEPTTHLDTEHIEWLEKQLRQWQGALVLVSHDRRFLDALCTTIWEIHEGQLTVYKGNYSDYAEQKKLEKMQQEQAYEAHEKKKAQLERALREKEQRAERAVKTPKKVSSSEARITGAKPYFAKKQKKLHQNAKAIETRLEQMEQVEKPRELAPIKMNLQEAEALKGRIILRFEKVMGRIGTRTLWKPTSFQIHGGDKLAVIGPNGCGKTTLLQQILDQVPGITVSPAVKIGYFSQNLNILNVQQSIIDNVSVTSIQDESLVRTILARLHFFGDDVYKPVNVLSGGERVKVALAKLFVSDLNTLILDEPTNFLDIRAVEALEDLLQGYEGTVIVVSHDRRFVEQIANRILAFHDGHIQLFDGSLDEFKSYTPDAKRDFIAEQLLILETKISEVLSRLSIAPSDELEQEFQRLLEQKRRLN